MCISTMGMGQMESDDDPRIRDYLSRDPWELLLAKRNHALERTSRLGENATR